MKKKSCKSTLIKPDARFFAFFLFLFTLPLFSFWAGYEVATLGGLVNQTMIVDDTRTSCVSLR
jgi:hypothetical protein